MTRDASSATMASGMRIALGCYLVVAFILCASLLVALWPGNVTGSPVPGAGGLVGNATVTTALPIVGAFTLTYEADLLALVLAAGATGGFVHAASSFAKYAGARALKASWGWWYFLIPLNGAALAMMSYLVFRGGVLVVAGTATPNVPAIIALAALSGLFAKQATHKLNEAFNALFRIKEEATADSLHVAQDAVKDAEDVAREVPVGDVTRKVTAAVPKIQRP